MKTVTQLRKTKTMADVGHQRFTECVFYTPPLIVGQICNNFEKNRAFYDKSMDFGTWLVDNNTKN